MAGESRYKVTSQTHVGPEREVNEDSVHTDERGGWVLLAVADGMGGHVSGDLASDAAIQAFVEEVEEGIAEQESLEPEVLLRDAALKANAHVQELIEQDTSLEGMGTTLVGSIVIDDLATVVNVGDSRAYHILTDGIEQVSEDHSLVQELLEEGALSEDEAENHPHSNVITQSIGTSESIDPDVFQVSLEEGLLLCSDGLSDVVSEDRVESILRTDDQISERAGQLIQEAIERGSDDNISVALVESKS